MTRGASDELEQEFGEIDLLIREGSVSTARTRLQKLDLDKQISENDLAIYARLLKRTGLAFEALKWLSRRLKNETAPRGPTQILWLEYADCHTRLNATSTAKRILKHPALTENRLRHLYLGTAHMHSWEQTSAEAELLLFLACDGSDSYSRWVARVNLIACFIDNQKLEQAASEIDELSKVLRQQRLYRLLYNVYELQVQLCALEKDHKGMLAALSAQQDIRLQGVGMVDELFTARWKAVYTLGKDKLKGLQEIELVRKKCVGGAYAELARDLDYFRYSATLESNIGSHLWYGTPYSGFRNKLGSIPAAPFVLSLPYRRPSKKPSPASARATQVLASLREQSSLIQRAFWALLADFYRVPNVVELFERIYPESYFNPYSSPLAVHQLMLRFRGFLGKSGSELLVRHQEAGYFLEAPQTFAMTLTEAPWSMLEMSPLETKLERLIRSQGTQIKAKGAAQELGLSLRAAQDLLKKMCDYGLLRLHGAARASYYEPVTKKTPQIVLK